MAGRLVMIHGVCWGVGQSTLCRALFRAMPDADVLWEDELSQPAIFTRAEFAAVADRFHRHNARPDARIGNPTASMLEDAYEHLVRTVSSHGRTALMGWSVMDLAEDLAGPGPMSGHYSVMHAAPGTFSARWIRYLSASTEISQPRSSGP